MIVSVACGWALIGRGSKVPDASRLSADQLDEYIQSGKIGELEPGERRAFFREAMESRTARQAESYFNTPVDMRAVYLDEVIASMQSRREEMFQLREMFGSGMNDPNESGSRSRGREDGQRRWRRGEESQGRGGQAGEGRRGQGGQNRRAPSLERRRARQERISPIVRAQTREFRRALRRQMSGR